MRLLRSYLIPCILFLAGCASSPNDLTPTIGGLVIQGETAEPEVNFDIDRQQVIDSYRALVEISEATGLHRDALRRLADLELEASVDNRLEEDSELQQQGINEAGLAIQNYERYLELFPTGENNDLILYQLSRAYALEGDTEKSLAALDRIASEYPSSRYSDEVQFRRGEILFVWREYELADSAYNDVVVRHPDSVFFEKSLYKLGWTKFKLNENRAALDTFIDLLDRYESAFLIHENKISETASRAERELAEDVLRVVSLTFSYEAEEIPMAGYFQQTGARGYEPLLYDRLASLYLEKERLTDAADVYLAYGANYPLSRHTPEFHQKAINSFEKGGFSTLVLEQKIAFVNSYDVNTNFWNQQSFESRQDLTPTLSKHLKDLATHYHAQARASKKPRDYQVAAGWYQRNLKSFPKGKEASQINFLYAESLFDARRFSDASREYEKTAYQYPAHKNSAESGYAALLAYDATIKGSKGEVLSQLKQQRVQSAIRFTKTFPQDNRVTNVELQTAQQFFEWKQYQQASQSAYRLSKVKNIDKKTEESAWTIIAHSHYLSNEFAAAEKGYFKLLEITSKKSKSRKEFSGQLSASIYKQGELATKAEDHTTAAFHYERLGKVVPNSPQRIIADYDAATAYITLKQWPKAITKLEQFRRQYPKDKKWRGGVTEKLALAYSENGNSSKAANEMMTLSSNSKSSDRKRDLMWRAAELYQEGGQPGEAIKIYKGYVRAYPNPLARSIELRSRIADSYLTTNDTKTRSYWLREIVKADAKGGQQRNDRSRYLAAKASLELIEPMHNQYQKTKLTVPLKKSLKKKKKLMQDSIKAYTRAIKYQVQEVTTKATFEIAEIYKDFANALLTSQRPKGLNDDQLEEYELLLEEQAYPFEEKAIDIHVSNFKRIPQGTWDDSTKRSLAALGELMPFRYSRAEASEVFVDVE